MNKIVQLIQKKLSDRTIRVTKIIFGIVYIGVLYYNFFVQEAPNTIQDNLFWVSISEQVQIIVMYIMVAFWLIPLVTWAANLCIAKSKYIRIAQIIYAVILFYFSHIILETPDLDVDVLLFFMAFIPLIWWISWKLITSKCSNYWYKQTKIRV